MDRADRIAKVRALYERASTPGEKEAARQALKRLGVDPDGEQARPRRPGGYEDSYLHQPDDGSLAASFVRMSKVINALHMDLTPVQRELFSELLRQEMEKGGARK